MSYPAVPLGGRVSDGGVYCPPAPSSLADKWWQDWGSVGGFLTIDMDGGLNPWFAPERGCSDEARADQLITELCGTPGLPAAVRILISELVRSGKRKVSHGE